MPKLWFILFVLCVQLFVRPTSAGQPYLVSEQSSGEIVRLEDINGDGDALDVGEQTLWSTGFGSVVGLDSTMGGVYAVERGLGSGNNEIVKLSDLNGDGDALDDGERISWASGLDDPRDVAHDAEGNFYVSDFGSNQVWQFVDKNHDGDALDVGERSLFAEVTGGAEMLLPWTQGMLLTTFNPGEVRWLKDLNGDGDSLDVGENIAIASGISTALSMLADGSGGLYIASFSDDTVYHASDNNGDHDFFDVAEVLSYADDVFGGVNGPWGLASQAGSSFLAANFVEGEVLVVRDENGDDDALDLGEVKLFASGLSLPTDLVPLLDSYDADYNGDGLVDGLDFLVWQRGQSPQPMSAFDLQLWEAQYGTAATQSSSATVPEPGTLLLALAGSIFGLSRRRS